MDGEKEKMEGVASMCGCSMISVQPLFSDCLFGSYYITQDSLSLMFTVQISVVFFLLKREIRLSEANPTKGK